MVEIFLNEGILLISIKSIDFVPLSQSYSPSKEYNSPHIRSLSN